MAARPFRFGVQISSAASRKEWVEKARQAEALGFSTLFMPDHFGDQLAPVPALMAAADATDNIRVGALVFDNDYRHPVVLAKEMATIDLLTEGRLEVGLGAGWMRSDYEESGIPYDPPGVRVDRFEEGLKVIKGLFADGAFSHSGTHYAIANLDGRPKPVQRPHPPILIGGGGPRVLRIAGREADIVGINFNLKGGEVTADLGPNGTAEMTDRKIEWIREGAGDRFGDIELNVLVFMATVTDDRAGTAEMIAPMFQITPEQALKVPHALVGSVDQICEDLQARRERFGFSYTVVQDGAMEDIGPVVERLTGT
jgi:probable F420-dependent oxidoreductase